MKPITPRIHGVLDYATVLVTALAPTLFGFSAVPSRIAYALAAGYLVLSLCTAYPLGVAKLVPFRGHGLAEVAIAVLLVPLPWMLGFADEPAPRNFMLALVLITFVVVPLTDFRAAEGAAAHA